MDKYTKTDAKRLGNAVSLFLNPDLEVKKADQAIELASNRLLNTAVLLRDGEFLGWQISKSNSGEIGSLVFSSAGVNATKEDFSWMFGKLATITTQSCSELADIYGGTRKVYVLTSMKGSDADLSDLSMQGTIKGSVGYSSQDYYCSDDDEYDDEPGDSVDYDRASHVNEWFMELFGMLMDNDAIIQVNVGPSSNDKGGHGLVMFSFPQDMPLRIRSLISMAFPHMKAVEVNGQDESTALEDKVSDSWLIGALSMFMNVLMINEADSFNPDDDKEGKCGQDEPDRNIASCTEAADSANGDEKSDSSIFDTDIVDLELTVRTTNCLRRAGIKNVGDLAEMSEDDLSRVRNMSRKCINEVIERLAFFNLKLKPGIDSNVSYMDQLNEMIGLSGVKDQVKHLVAYAKMKNDMRGKGCCSLDTTFNMAFLGNPGTAKTTVARIVAGLFSEIGLLKQYHVVEAGRADIVAKYVGQTAPQVKALFEKAKGGVLFIDEAYSLVDDSENSFGDEAVSTIVQEMENNRRDTVVILAGYPDKMEEFLSRNPGLKSRVPFKITFEDYSADEMGSIAQLEAKKKGFSISADAMDKVVGICETAVGNPDAGNGRFARNLVEHAIMEYALRTYGADDTSVRNTDENNGENGSENTGERTFELSECDFGTYEAPKTGSSQNRIGF